MPVARDPGNPPYFYVNLARVQIDPRVLSLLPPSLINQHKAVPIAFCNNRLTLAMTNPNNIVAFDDVRRILKGVLIEPVVVTEDDLRRFMATTYAQLAAAPDTTGSRPGRPPLPPASGGPGSPEGLLAKANTSAMVDLLQSDLVRELQLAADTGAGAAETKQDLMSASEDAPIIRLANSVLGLAIGQGASDIHIEPMENDVTVRFRIDGVLQVVQRLPKRVLLGLISRLKILSKLDISEKRLPQDGRISVTMEGKPIDFRVSTVPGKWGEKVVMRGSVLTADGLAFFACLVYLARAYHRQTYVFLPLLGEIDRSLKEFLKFAPVMAGGEAEVLEAFENQMRQRMIDAADRNTQTNDERSALLHRARLALYVVLLLTAVAGLPYVVDQVRY